MPKFDENDWRSARAELAASRDAEEVRERLLHQAERLADLNEKAETGAARFGDRFWKSMGLSVREKEMRYEGAHYETNTSRIVWVRSGSSKLRQKFTVAHELSHLLLRDVRTDERSLVTAKDEERFCNDFASRLLIPPVELRPYLADETPLTIGFVTHLCRIFGVNYQPMLLALAHSCSYPHMSALVVRRYGHPKRKDEIDYRGDASPMPPIYLPPDHRLSSAGFADVTNWAAGLPAGQQNKGRTENVNLKLWVKHVGSGSAKGASNWEALTLADERILILFDTRELQLKWNKRKHR